MIHGRVGGYWTFSVSKSNSGSGNLQFPPETCSELWCREEKKRRKEENAIRAGQYQAQRANASGAFDSW